MTDHFGTLCINGLTIHCLVLPHRHFIISPPVEMPYKMSTQVEDEFTKSYKAGFSFKVLEMTFSKFFLLLSKCFFRIAKWELNIFPSISEVLSSKLPNFPRSWALTLSVMRQATCISVSDYNNLVPSKCGREKWR